MQLNELAEKLVAARSAAERSKLLAGNKKLAGGKVARAIRDVCYASWTSTPATARRAADALKSLYKLSSGEEVEAFLLWIAGIAELTKGNLELAIENLDRASEKFLALNCGHESAQTRVARLIALALLGRYDEAVETGEAVLKILKKFGDELTAGKVEKNLGNIVSRQGRHRDAEKYYLSAQKRFLRIGEKSEQIMAENGLAITYTQLNDFRRAEKFFAQALKNAAAAGMLLTAAEIEASMGNMALFRGRYDEALRYLELSRRKYEELDMPHQTAVAGLEIADIYQELNLIDEAVEIYAEVSGKLSALKMQGEEARARANFGRALLRKEELEIARREFEISAELFEKENNRPGAAAVLLEKAQLDLDQNDIENAVKTLNEAGELLRRGEAFRERLVLKLLLAETHRRKGKKAQAKKQFAGIVDKASEQEQPRVAIAALNSLGEISEASGNLVEARKYFSRAIDMVEKLRAPLAGEEFRMAFLADKLQPFEKMAAIYLQEKKFIEAFLMTERARSRALEENLGTTVAEVAGASKKLSTELSRLREELNWSYSRLSRATGDETKELFDGVRSLEKKIAAVARQIESTGKAESSSKGKFDRARLRELRQMLGAKELLIEFVTIDGAFSAFVVDDKKVSFVKDISAVDEIMALLEGLHFQFGALRYGAAIPEKLMPELKRRADIYLQKLYDKLARPLEKFLGDRNLIIVPAAALYYVPFQALFDGSKYLIESREISYAPSAAIWQALQKKPARKIKRAMLMGFADEKIPHVDSEIARLKKIFPGAKSFTGRESTFDAYTRNAPKFDLLHLACHGQFRPENPMFSSLHLADGWVTVRDICAQRLPAGLVTLSACETGLNKIFAGDEIIGLSRGFLSAGVNSIIMSLWTVNDRAAAELMDTLYRNIRAGESVQSSLRSAQVEFIRRGHHPYFWSPFSLIG